VRRSRTRRSPDGQADRDKVHSDLVFSSLGLCLRKLFSLTAANSRLIRSTFKSLEDWHAKTWNRYQCVLIAGGAGADGAGETGQHGRVFVTVPSGMAQQYEEGRERHMDWHRKQGDTWTWDTWQVETGQRVVRT